MDRSATLITSTRFDRVARDAAAQAAVAAAAGMRAEQRKRLGGGAGDPKRDATLARAHVALADTLCRVRKDYARAD